MSKSLKLPLPDGYVEATIEAATEGGGFILESTHAYQYAEGCFIVLLADSRCICKKNKSGLKAPMVFIEKAKNGPLKIIGAHYLSPYEICPSTGGLVEYDPTGKVPVNRPQRGVIATVGALGTLLPKNFLRREESGVVVSKDVILKIGQPKNVWINPVLRLLQPDGSVVYKSADTYVPQVRSSFEVANLTSEEKEKLIAKAKEMLS